MSVQRYHRADIRADFFRAGIGLAACLAPIPFLEPGAAATYVLAAPAAFFALFGWRTYKYARTRIEMNADGLRASGGQTGSVRWDDLRDVRLSYFSTRRDRESGWMQLKVKDSRGALAIHSTLEGFENICRAAYQAADARGLTLRDATARNFAVIGLGAAEIPKDTTPAALSGWGNPADWRR